MFLIWSWDLGARAKCEWSALLKVVASVIKCPSNHSRLKLFLLLFVRIKNKIPPARENPENKGHNSAEAWIFRTILMAAACDGKSLTKKWKTKILQNSPLQQLTFCTGPPPLFFSQKGEIGFDQSHYRRKNRQKVRDFLPKKNAKLAELKVFLPFSPFPMEKRSNLSNFPGKSLAVCFVHLQLLQ